MKLLGKKALVTGAAGGIGLAVVAQLQAQGAVVCAADLSLDNSNADFKIAGDLTDSNYCNSLANKASELMGGLDILVNNAGLMRRGVITDATDEDFQLSMAVNVEAPFRLCRAAIPLMEHAGGGAIVNTSSCWGIHPGPGHPIYIMTKAAIASLTQCLGRDHAHQNIRINAVCPNEVDTPMLRTGFAIRGLDPDNAINELNQSVPLGRIASANDIADVVLFLVSDESRYMCGSLVEVEWWKTRLMSNISDRFKGKVCLVTGASSGIGLACALHLVDQGGIVFTAQRTESNDALKYINADFEDQDTPQKVITEIIKQTGKLDVLINNAGLMQEGLVEDMSLDAWEKTLRVNLTAPFLLIKHAIPHLRKTKGSIVNIGSIEGLASNPQHSAYCASKAGIHGLTRAVAVDYGKEGIRCNAVAPGWIDTPLNIDFIESMTDPEGFKEKIGDIHPVGRTGKPQEVAKLVAWLASDEASFITGQVMTIDGGRTSKLSLP